MAGPHASLNRVGERSTLKVEQTDAELNSIRVLARRFRAAMDSTDFTDTQWLSRFPVEGCDITCKLLGLYLYEHGVRDFAIMSGRRPADEEGRHQWLQLGHIVIDITADQFTSEGQAPVIVATDSRWHLDLHGHRLFQFDEDFYRKLKVDPWQQFTRKMYARISGNLRG